MKYFIFNNKNSYNDLGIIIKEMPAFFRAEKNIETIEVEGRNGTLHIDNNTYKSINISIKCIVYDKTKIDSIKLALQGTGNLIFSDFKDRFYTATIKNQILFDKYLSVLSEFPLQLELQPFARKIEKTTLNKTEDSTFSIEGNVLTYPIITVTGTGTFTLNNKSIKVTESDIVIDCELMNCTKSSLNKNNKVELIDFPELLPGENNLTVGNGITNIKIEYYARWY